LTDLTGLVSEKLQLHNDNGIFPHRSIKSKDELWEKLMRFHAEGTMMGCSSNGAVEREIIIDGEKTGIMSNHAYSLLDMIELQRPDKGDENSRKFSRLLRIRNPWGQLEWRGKWADDSEQIEEHKELIDQMIASKEEDERWIPGENDGTFLMCFKDFREIFNSIFMCVDFPNERSGVRFINKCTAYTSGGTPSPLTEEKKKLWAKNPQYTMTLQKEAELFISLAQEDGRLIPGLKFPYLEHIHPVCFTISVKPKDKAKLDLFDPKALKCVSNVKEHREVTHRITLLPGEYVLVPSTKDAGQLGNYYLSIYFNCEKKFMKIERVGNKDDPALLIEEEEEDYHVEKTRLELVKKRLKGVIFNSDKIDDITDAEVEEKGRGMMETVKYNKNSARHLKLMKK